MAGLIVDDDWKKQAQEEKRKLAEEAEKQKAAPPAASPFATGSAAGSSASAAPKGRAAREMPPASFETLVQSIVTQTLYYLGDIATRGAESMVNLDLAKHHLDTLAVIEEKTKSNLSADEQSLLDAALYEARARFVAVGSQMIV